MSDAPVVRLALLGAFAFPAPQGSQRFAAEQARALGELGIPTTLFCYGNGDGRPHPGVRVERIARKRSPRRLRAGFDRAKPRADLALRDLLLHAHRETPFDAVLAHNAEAAGVALAARRRGGPPCIHVVHTLWAEELPSYLPARLRRLAAGAGRLLDAGLAWQSDATLVLSRRAEQALSRFARGPLECIPPPFRTAPEPGPEKVRAACQRHGLLPEGYVLYAGNLDAYQDLPLLDSAAARLPEQTLVVATHDPRQLPLAHLRRCVVRDPEEARALVFGARLAVLPRRRAGGFPVKLLGYMEAGRAILASAAAAHTLEHGTSAWLLPASAGADAWASALQRLLEDAKLRRRLGCAARQVLETRHAPEPCARATLELVGRARSQRPGR